MTILLTLVFAALGAILASFTGVIAERINTGQAWWKGRSRCNSCRRTLTVIDLIPIFSWLYYRGRCRTCRARVPVTYAIFEALLALSFALSYLQIGLSFALFVFLAALVVLGFIVLYDLRHTIVPMWSSSALIALAFLYAIVRPSSTAEFLVNAGISLLIALAFFMIYAISRGRAMGLAMHRWHSHSRYLLAVRNLQGSCSRFG